jgi:hypothetical protein
VIDLRAGVKRGKLRRLQDPRQRSSDIVVLVLDTEHSRLLGGGIREIVVWDRVGGNGTIAVLSGHAGAVRQLAWAGNRRAASLGADGRCVSGIPTLHRLASRSSPTPGTCCVGANVDGSVVWSSSPGEWLCSWRVSDRVVPEAEAFDLRPNQSWVLAFDPHGKYSVWHSKTPANWSWSGCPTDGPPPAFRPRSGIESPP